MNLLEMTETGLSVGGAVSANKLLGSDLLTGSYSVLKDAGLKLANNSLRNRATLIGNLCNASPGGDMIGASMILGGCLVAVSSGNTRSIPLDGFFTGVKTHSLRKDELAVKIVIPRMEGKGVFLKKQRTRGHDLAQVSLTAFRHDDDSLDLVLGAVAPVPVLIRSMVGAGEAPHTGRIAESALTRISPISDVRSSREYRIAMVKYYISQAVKLLYGKDSQL